MEKLILADNTEIQILDGASLGSISTGVADWTAAGTLVDKLTDENLKKVKFVSGDDISGEYTDMTLVTPVQYTPGSPAVLTFGIRERTTEEIQQEDVQTAIEYLTDEQALTVKNLYPEYDPNGKEYKTGNRAVQDGVLYKCLQDHTSQPDWAPGQCRMAYCTSVCRTILLSRIGRQGSLRHCGWRLTRESMLVHRRIRSRYQIR